MTKKNQPPGADFDDFFYSIYTSITELETSETGTLMIR